MLRRKKSGTKDSKLPQDLERTVRSLITPEAVNWVIAQAWMEDTNRVSWCAENSPPEMTPETLLEVLALDRWLRRDPVFQGPMTLASVSAELPRIKAIQQSLCDELRSEPISIWQTNAEICLGGDDPIEPFPDEGWQASRRASAWDYNNYWAARRRARNWYRGKQQGS